MSYWLSRSSHVLPYDAAKLQKPKLHKELEHYYIIYLYIH
jgi:hypothetical protein